MPSTDRWVIIGRPNCPYCDKAKTALRDQGLDYQYLDYTAFPALKNFLVSCGLATVPQVYLNGDRIGGYTDLDAYLRWENLIEEAGNDRSGP